MARIETRLPLLCVWLAFPACDRSEGMHAPQAGGTETSRPTVTTTATATTSAVPAPPCLVPTPAEPPPPQQPASMCPADPGAPFELSRGAVSFPDAPGAPRIGVELARTPAEHARGLMYRTSLPEEQGMLFSWDDDKVRSFWMQNTCIPLDMLFIARDGTILGIQEQVPVLNQVPRSIPCPAAHVLEVNAGFCRRHGVKAGMHVVVEP